jgi:hypothetical protein
MVDIDTSEFHPMNGIGSVLVVRRRLLTTRRSVVGAAGVAFTSGLQVGEAISVSSDGVSSRRAGQRQGSGLQAAAWLPGWRRRPRRRPSCGDSS